MNRIDAVTLLKIGTWQVQRTRCINHILISSYALLWKNMRTLTYLTKITWKKWT